MNILGPRLRLRLSREADGALVATTDGFEDRLTEVLLVAAATAFGDGLAGTLLVADK